MKALIAAACIAVIASAGLFFYRDYQRQQATSEYAKESSLRRVCQHTLPGGKYFGMKAMTEQCRKSGYID